ncbi:zinc ribbon domain-containing protein [Algoriphagus resistens]|uniref:zinc ribbon domain-containing protein n=1 Tax=Algoriphagus resistens TaxID=1750590 RepID=UPI0009EC42C8|nr:zinc ribbon domain-containing protein [Algoriphagus resistens]
MLEYKANWNDRPFVKIDRWFPSSKSCSACGWIKQDLTLSIREWVCGSCGEIHDRDVNAAKENILTQGIKAVTPTIFGSAPFLSMNVVVTLYRFGLLA